MLPLYGGSDFRDQIHKLRRGVHVVVGTPGRVMDHMRQGTLNVSQLETLVLDEADEMLRMGFIDDVQWVLEQLPSERQVVLFSATMPPEIKRICQQHLQNPAEIIIRTQKADASRIRQRHILLPHQQKLGLSAGARSPRPWRGDHPCRTKAVTVTVAEALEAEGITCSVLNGDVPQSLRERTIERLKQGRIDVLVATDVAARGLDVDRIGLVVNYDAPLTARPTCTASAAPAAPAAKATRSSSSPTGSAACSTASSALWAAASKRWMYRAMRRSTSSASTTCSNA